MNRAQEEAASTCCTGKGTGFNLGNFKLNNIWIWVIVVLVIFCCCNGGNFIGGYGDYGCKSRKNCKAGGTGLLGNYWVLILIVVLCACSGGGIGGGGGLLGNAGNVNTNVINVQSDDGYDEDDPGYY